MSKAALTHGSLFSGIGGFDLGFERAGFETVWQVEIDEYCRRVLERHFPRAERFADIRECGAHNLKWVDCITGGFPCQDISQAGERAGIDGDRSGLWSEMYRILGELRPGFVVVENVSALLDRGMGRVVGDLASIGYDCEWQMLSGCRLGAPHSRDRVFLVAYPSSERPISHGMGNGQEAHRWPHSTTEWGTDWIEPQMGNTLPVVEAWGPEVEGKVEPCFIGVADGIPPGLDERRKMLGNSVMPKLAQWIAERIKAITA